MPRNIFVYTILQELLKKTHITFITSMPRHRVHSGHQNIYEWLECVKQNVIPIAWFVGYRNAHHLCKLCYKSLP